MLSAIREAEGDLAQASELLQDLQVETFGSMDRREKVDFILEQMRLLKALGDWDKMGIVAKRINIKWLAEKDHEVRLVRGSREGRKLTSSARNRTSNYDITR
jgi:26S proteasome regulatory subunit N5